MNNESRKVDLSKASLGILGVLLLTLVVWHFGGPDFLHYLGFGLMTEWYVFASRSFFWLWLLMLWAYAARIERLELLIWEERRYEFPRYLALILVIAGLVFVGTLVVNIMIRLIMHKRELSEPLRQTVAVLRANKLLLVYTALTAGVTEELIFRGYLLPRLEMIFKNRNWAILVSSLLFGLAHGGYGTIKNVVDAFIIGLVLAYYYSKYRNIKMVIIFHVLWDLAALYLSLAKLK